MSDKLNKNINESMLEGLLSDEDKPKPPKPVAYQPYSGGGYNYRNQNSFDWSRGDPLHEDDDELYHRTRGTARPTGATSYATKPATSKFIAGGGAVSMIREALAGGKHSGQKHYFLPEAEANLLVKGVVTALGDLFDATGLCWGASGSKQASAFVYDMMLSNVFYNTPSRGFKELDFGGEIQVDGPVHDPLTGEIYEDEERKAIQQEGGNND